MSETTTETTTSGTTETTQSVAPPEWLAKIDEPIRNTLTAKGWADPDPVAALGKVAAGYVNAEKAIGADKVVLPPKGQDGKRDFTKWDGWSALGVPDKPEAYTFEKPEGFDAYSDDMAGAFKGAAHAAKLTPAQAAALHDFWVKTAQDGAGATKAEAERQLASLQAEWGAEYPAKAAQARNGATPALEHAGLTGEDFDRIGNAIGHDKAVKMFQYFGSKIGEDRAVEGEGAGLGITRDPAAAQREIASLRLEPAYLNAKDPKHAEINRRLQALYAVAYPEQAA